MDSRSVFDKNLAAIRERSAQLAAALEAASLDGIEEVTGPRGARVLRERGVLLGSAYDPAREGIQLAEKMAEAPTDIMVAIGFGLGEQFEAYCERNPGTLVIYEPSLARLAAALQRISLVNLLATQRDLFIATEPDQFTRLLNARYVPGLRVRVFPHPAVLRLDGAAVAEIVERTRRVKDASDTRSLTSIEMLMPWAWVTARNGRRIAGNPAFGRIEGAFEGKPAVIVAAGPSLDKQLPLLREWRDRVLIIAIGQTVKALRQAGIEPDLVHVLESRDVSHQLTDAGDTRDLCITLTPDAHPAIFDVPTRATFVSMPLASPMGVWIGQATGESGFTMGGGTVAQGAVGLAVGLGANPILLIGQDLAFTDGRAYAKATAYDFVEVSVGEDGDCTFNNMKKKVGLLGDTDLETIEDEGNTGRTVWVDGWNEGEKVPTFRAYAAFIEQYRDIGLYLASRDIELVNCTEGGARIPALAHRPFCEALEAFATEPFDAREILIEGHDAAPVRGLGDYREPIEDARRKLSLVEKETRKAEKFSKKSKDRLLNARNDQQRVEILRGLARFEKRIRRQLERMPWLDALVQPEIYNAIAAVRRTERQDPSIEDLAEESSFLFEAASRGVERAREWFDLFEASFDESAGVRDAVERVAAPELAPVPRPRYGTISP